MKARLSLVGTFLDASVSCELPVMGTCNPKSEPLKMSLEHVLGALAVCWDQMIDVLSFVIDSIIFPTPHQN